MEDDVAGRRSPSRRRSFDMLDGLGYTATAVMLILMWYGFSIGITFYNKWLFGAYGLNFPLSVTVMHMVSSMGFSCIGREIRHRLLGAPKPVLSLRDFVMRVSPTGMAGAFDIGLSNLSLTMIEIVLYTICKSTVLCFVLMFSIAFRLERPSCSIFIVIFMITLGVVLFRLKEGVSFHSTGFLLVMCASASGGLRWVLTQLVMSKESLGLTHPIDTIFHVAPWMTVTLLPFAVALEGDRLMKSELLLQGSMEQALMTLLAVVVGSCLAFGLVLSEFLLVSHTSGLTLSVAGILKEICTILLAVIVTGEGLSAVNVLGLVVSIVGIAYYNYIKFGSADTSGLTHAHGHGSSAARTRYSRLSNVEEFEMQPVET
eukprot:m.102742 g.102742  ORF g.102742 m.102742 type:complete len:372 (+) comp15700_c0_seq2:600-1715(+)